VFLVTIYLNLKYHQVIEPWFPVERCLSYG
jgi:hypothetical protein